MEDDEIRGWAVPPARLSLCTATYGWEERVRTMTPLPPLGTCREWRVFHLPFLCWPVFLTPFDSRLTVILLCYLRQTHEVVLPADLSCVSQAESVSK